MWTSSLRARGPHPRVPARPPLLLPPAALEDYIDNDLDEFWGGIAEDPRKKTILDGMLTKAAFEEYRAK